MLIIAGYIDVDAEGRDAYVEESRQVVAAAHEAPGCLDFAMTADSLDARRVRVYERWETEDALMAFRGSGPSGEQQSEILAAEVRRFGVDSIGPA
jgi:quinol monooxygenase YgiN